MASKVSRTFHTLDALRGVAAIAVVNRHCPALFGTLRLENSQLAVDLFFVLSGFVLTHAYKARFEAGMTPARFMILRFIRLYPLYILGTAIGLVTFCIGALTAHTLSAGSLPALTSNALLSLFMLPSLPSERAAFLYPFDQPAWSLAFELVGNFVFAVVLTRGLSRSVGTVSIAILIASALGLAIEALLSGGIGSGFEWGSAYAGLFRLGYSFTLGAIIYHFPRYNWRVGPLCLAGVLFVLLAVGFDGIWDRIYQLVCVLVAFPILVAAGASVEPGALWRRLCWLLGTTSYGIYALHKPLEEAIAGGLTRLLHLPLDRATPWAGFAFVAALMAVVVVLDRYFDVPVRAYLEQRTRPHPSTVNNV